MSININRSKVKKYVIAAIFVAAFIYMKIINDFPILYLLAVFAFISFAVMIFNRRDLMAFIANYYFTVGNTEKATVLYKAEIDRNTNNAGVYLNYSTVLVRDGNAGQALIYLNKALGLKPDILTEKNILLTLGSCHWVLGDIEKAIEVLESLRSKYAYVNNHVLTTLGYLYLLSGNIEKALELTNSAIQEAPESGSAWDNLGQIHYKRSDFPAAKEAFLKAVGYNPNLVDSYYYLGRIASLEKNSSKALEYFQKAQSCNITYLNTVTKEQIDEAIEEIKQQTS